MMRTALLLVALAFMPNTGHARWHHYPRDPDVPRAFQRTHPCPSTGRAYGRCPGYVRDHIMPLCAGGADSVTNMQWQSRYEAHAKDRDEWALCRSLHRRH